MCGWRLGSLEDVYHPQRYAWRLAVLCCVVGLIFTFTAAYSLIIARYGGVPVAGLLLAIFGFVLGRWIRSLNLCAAYAVTCGIAAAVPMVTLTIAGCLFSLYSYDTPIWAVIGIACGAASMIIVLIFAAIGRWSAPRRQPR